MVEVKVLGPVEAWSNDQRLLLPRRQQRLILGVLALEANHVVAADRLIDLLWPEHPPDRARAILQTRVSELRSALHATTAPEEVRLIPQGAGYLLRIAPDQVDAGRFLTLTAAARDADSDESARTALRTALSLWRGPILGPDAPTGHPDLGLDLESARGTATEDLYDTELRLGNHRRVADELRTAATAEPSRERLTELLIRALHRSGRTAEALQAYETHRQWLATELGTDPSDPLQRLHLALLRGDPEPPATPTPPPGPPTSGFKAAVPHLLPTDISDFSGRTAEADHLHHLLTADPTAPAITPVVAVSGAGGIGKTALCVRVAHRLRDHFPDGQLYADLRGIEQDQPVQPLDLLGRFLRALGVDGLAMPDTLDERAELYRDLLANRKLLILLDNAAADDQIQPLIPASPGSRVLVNGRQRLGFTLGAHQLHLDVLNAEQSIALLSRIAGPDRIAAEPDAAADLAQLCGHLPLALRVMAARLAAKPHWTVDRLATMLHDEHRRLDEFRYGHLDVRATIALSCAGLSLAALRLFHLAGHVDLPDLTVWITSAIIDSDIPTAEALLEELFDAQLLDINGHDNGGYPRYRMHDLVQLYARERAEHDLPGAELEAALRRALGAWLHITDIAYLIPRIDDSMTIHGDAPRWTVDPETVRTLMADQSSWIDSESSSIFTMVHRAARDGHIEECWDLACTTAELFENQQNSHNASLILDVARAAAAQAGDRRGHAAALWRAGCLIVDQLQYEQASQQLLQACALFEQIDDRHGLALVHVQLSIMNRFHGNVEAALWHCKKSLDLLPTPDKGDLAALALRNMSQVLTVQGRHEQAEVYFSRVLQFCRSTGTRAEAQALFFHGMLRLKEGRTQDAENEFREALKIVRGFRDQEGTAQCLRGLALCHRDRGDRARAASMLSEALELIAQPRPTRSVKLIAADLERL